MVGLEIICCCILSQLRSVGSHRISSLIQHLMDFTMKLRNSENVPRKFLMIILFVWLET